MPPSSGEVPGRFFATDLRLIRKHHQVTLDDVSRKTKIPVEIVDLFEQTGLLDHPRFNEIYLRSFVKQYAQAIGVAQRSALAALEASLDERYTGSLAEEYLPASASSAPTVSDDAEPGASPESTVSEEEPEDAPEQPRPATPTAGAAQAGTDEHGYSIDALKKEAASVPRHRRAETRRRRPAIAPPIFSPAVLFGLLVILLTVLIYFAWPILRTPTPEAAPEGIDTTTVDPVPRLPDTLRVVLAAEGGPLSGIRVQIDEEDSRRYWIEPSDSIVFQVRDRIAITAATAMENLGVRVDGVQLPTGEEVGEGVLTYDRNEIARILGVEP